jgi:LacI family gluconate utilization system Gnt-I transcriptional repressor
MVIGFDHVRVGAEVAGFFRAKGYDRFASLAASDSRALARGRGFTEAATNSGGTVVAALTTPAPSTIAAGREGLRAMLPLLDRRCALFCSSDLIAFGVVTEARVLNISIPEQLAICGFGNLELSALNEPSITTVSVEGTKTGHSAAALLLRRLAGGEQRDNGQLQVPFRIIERAST